MNEKPDSAALQRGTIMSYSPAVSAGVIKTEDGAYYYFRISEWRSDGVIPDAQMKVTFEKINSGVSNVRAIK